MKPLLKLVATTVKQREFSKTFAVCADISKTVYHCINLTSL